jgi:hypothetical protein
VNLLARNRLPQFAERAQATARAAHLTPDIARHLLVMDVFQNSIGVLGRFGAFRQVERGPLAIFERPFAHALGACTSAVVFDSHSADGELMHARNFDFPGVGISDKFPTLVYCSPNHGIPYGYLGTRGGDVPGITAFNAEGITVTVHTRFHKDVDFTATGIVDLGHEIISQARTIHDAIEIVSRHKIASTWGILVTSAKEKNAVVIETTAKKMRVTWARDGHLGNTNHYLHPDLVQDEIATSNGWTSYTVDRLRLLDKFFAEMQAKGGATLSDMQSILGADYEVDDPGSSRMMGSLIGHVMSVQSVVFKLESGLISLSVGEAPTGWGPYINHQINWAGDALSFVDPAREKFTAVSARYGSGAGLEAYRNFQNAYLTDFNCGALDAVRAQLTKASAYAVEDSSLRFVEGVFALEAGYHERAYRHLSEAVALEKSPYRKAQALLWAARAAAATGKSAEAAALRREIFSLSHHNLAEIKRIALRDASQFITKRDYSDVVVNMSILDAA